MTEDTREKQIREEAKEYAIKNFSVFEMAPGAKGYFDGATHQHPISFEHGRKEGWNEAIDNLLVVRRRRLEEAVKRREEYGTYTDGWLEWTEAMTDLNIQIKELESLRNERA